MKFRLWYFIKMKAQRQAEKQKTFCEFAPFDYLPFNTHTLDLDKNAVSYGEKSVVQVSIV